MFGADEFTVIGNMLMGIAAIVGVGGMLYAAGSSMADMRAGNLDVLEPTTEDARIVKALRRMRDAA